jgi:large subunit ribosomal protein L25
MTHASTRHIVLEVESRAQTGGPACRRLRRQGRIPGNVYGLDRPPFKVTVSPRRLDELLRLGSGVNTVFQLSLVGEDRTRAAMIKELQRDPVHEQPVHVDFIRVDPTKRIQVSVPVRLTGTPEGVKNEGGIIDFVNRVVHLECLPDDIPEHLDVDISALHVNQHVSVSDLFTDEAVQVLDDAEQIIAVVVAPRVEEEVAAPEEEVAEAAEGEPELAKKGKEAEPSADASDTQKAEA